MAVYKVIDPDSPVWHKLIAEKKATLVERGGIGRGESKTHFMHRVARAAGNMSLVAFANPSKHTKLKQQVLVEFRKFSGMSNMALNSDMLPNIATRIGCLVGNITTKAWQGASAKEDSVKVLRKLYVAVYGGCSQSIEKELTVEQFDELYNAYISDAETMTLMTELAELGYEENEYMIGLDDAYTISFKLLSAALECSRGAAAVKDALTIAGGDFAGPTAPAVAGGSIAGTAAATTPHLTAPFAMAPLATAPTDGALIVPPTSWYAAPTASFGGSYHGGSYHGGDLGGFYTCTGGLPQASPSAFFSSTAFALVEPSFPENFAAEQVVLAREAFGSAPGKAAGKSSTSKQERLFTEDEMRASSNAARNEGAILGVAHGLAQGMQLVASTIPKAVKSLEAKLDASVETITATVEQGSAAIEAHVSAGNAGLAAHITTGNAGLAAHITAGFAGQIRVLRATEDRAEAARAQDRAADLARQRAAEDLAMATTAAGMGRIEAMLAPMPTPMPTPMLSMPTEEATAAGAEEMPEEAPAERVAKRQAGAEALVVGRLRGDAKDHHAKRSRTCPASSTMRVPFGTQVRPVAAPVPLARRTDANARPDHM